MKDSDFFDINELAALLKISRGSIYARICRGDLPFKYCKFGRLLRFPAAEVENYLASLPRIGATENRTMSGK